MHVGTGTQVSAVLLLTVLCIFNFAFSMPAFRKHSFPLTDESVRTYLEKFGYLKSKRSNRIRLFSADRDLEDGLKKLQKFVGIEPTGKLDDDTVNVLNTPRCHLPDLSANNSTTNKRFSTYSKWSINKLTYSIRNSPTNKFAIGNDDVVAAQIQSAFQDWSDVANLNFNQIPSDGNIKLSFELTDHGDGYPFDGPFGVLAHAFFPEYSMIHFDDAETWSSEGTVGFNLRQVTTHEIGHSLGLQHSSEPDAIMGPYFYYRTNFTLTQDDINGIQSLYGAKPPKAVIIKRCYK